MVKKAVAVALATTVLAGSAHARDRAWYIGIEGGAVIAESANFGLGPFVQTNPPTTGISFPNALRQKYDTGWEVAGQIGYDFGLFRSEFEVGYRDNRLGEVQVNGNIGNLANPVNGRFVPPAGVYPDPGGNIRVLSFMLNGMFDFGGEESRWAGFVGGGVGIARTKAHIWQLEDFGVAYNDDSDTGFAWQAIAGLRYALSDRVDLGFKYRFFNVPDLKMVTTNGRDIEGRHRTHSFLVGLTFNLFEAAPPPPPPAAVVPGPFLVFFDWDRSDITPEAAAILDRAAEAYMQTGQTSVVIEGHTDTSGPADYNQRLSERRANAVKAYMLNKGIPESQMTTRGFGFTRLLVDTPLGVREPQNRRAEIIFGGR